MLLKGIDGTMMVINIDGYQYPVIEDDPYGYDRNWITVSVLVKTRTSDWSGTESCMNTAEAEDLLKWLMRLASRDKTSPEFHLIEPCLHFETSELSDNLVVLDIFLNGAFHPSYKKHKVWSQEDHKVSIVMERGELTYSIFDWKEATGRFPSRGENPVKKWLEVA